MYIPQLVVLGFVFTGEHVAGEDMGALLPRAHYYHTDTVPWLLGQEETVDSDECGLQERAELGVC